MTREEAIEILRNQHRWTGEPEKINDVRAENEALYMAIKALEQRPQFIIKANGTIEQILSKTEETEESGIKYLNINVASEEVERKPDIVRLCSDAGNIEYVKSGVRDSIHTPDFNSEVQRSIAINTAFLATLADRVDILERKLSEYEKIL